MTAPRFVPTMALLISPPPPTPAVERYAEALATLHDLRAEARPAFLASLGFSVEAWTAFDRTWTTALARAGNAGESSLAQAFASAFARARLRLRATPPPSTGAPESSDATLEVPLAAPRAALPFARGAVDPASFGPTPPLARGRCKATGALPAVSPAPALPFRLGKGG